MAWTKRGLVARVSRTQLAVALLAATVPPAAWSLEPPGAAEAAAPPAQLRAQRDLARKLGNHRPDPYVLKRAMVRAHRALLRAAGRSPTEIEAVLPTPAPPPAWRGMPSRGSVKVLALLIEFSDYVHATPAAAVHQSLFGTGNPAQAPYESLAAYYRRASYGQLDLSQGTTLGWYRTAYPRGSVQTNQDGREGLIKEALSYYEAQGHDFSQYDYDGDGTIDYLIVIWTGPDNGWANFWWGYQTTFGDASYRLDNKTLGRYSWQWESQPPGGLFTPRVAIHETGHALGLPDLYDYDDTVGPRGGVGGLDMMDANRGDHNCFSKWVLDWLTPAFHTGGSLSRALVASGNSQDCVVIFPGPLGNPFAEYFVVQNRHRVGNDSAGMPADGMLIWHVDATLDSSGQDFAYDNSYTAHKLVRLMEADGLEQIEQGRAADAGDYYQAGTRFGDCTVPSSRRYSGSATGVELGALGAPGPTMNATFSLGPPTAPDYAVTAVSTSAVSVEPGGHVDVTYTARNLGSAGTACIELGVVLSPDATLTPSDTILQRWNHPGCTIPACGSVTDTRTVTIPAGIAEAEYFVGVIADIGGAQPEPEEANNARGVPLNVGLPGLRTGPSLHAGIAIPTGSLSNSTNLGPIAALDFVYAFTRRVALDARLGYSRLTGKNGMPDREIADLSLNGKYAPFLTVPWSFVNGGLGLVYIDWRDLELGANVGVGVGTSISARLDAEVTVNYHLTLTGASTLGFLRAQVGVVWKL